jgi:hypothetical protein
VCNAEAPEDGRMWDIRLSRGIKIFKYSHWMIFRSLLWMMSRDIRYEGGRRRLVGTSVVSSFGSNPFARGDSHCL